MNKKKKGLLKSKLNQLQFVVFALTFGSCVAMTTLSTFLNSDNPIVVFVEPMLLTALSFSSIVFFSFAAVSFFIIAYHTYRFINYVSAKLDKKEAKKAEETEVQKTKARKTAVKEQRATAKNNVVDFTLNKQDFETSHAPAEVDELVKQLMK